MFPADFSDIKEPQFTSEEGSTDRPHSGDSSNLAIVRGPVASTALRTGMEIVNRGFFPYTTSASAAVVPIRENYESLLLQRVRELAEFSDQADFEDRLIDIVLRDLKGEGPRFRFDFSTQTEEQRIIALAELSAERRIQIEDLFKIEIQTVPTLWTKIGLGAFADIEEKKIIHRNPVDVSKEIEASQTLREKALILLLAMKNGFIEMDPAAFEVLKLSTQLAQFHRYTDAVSLLDFSMLEGPVKWASRVTWLVDQVALIQFAAGNFTLADAKFEEAARHGRFARATVPYNFHYGIVRLAHGATKQASLLLANCASGFNEKSVSIEFNEAAQLLCAKVEESRLPKDWLLPELKQ